MSLNLKRKKKTKTKQVSYEELGKMLQNIYETGYIDRNQMYKMSFIKGMLSGLGGVLGATILVALLLWTLSLFSSVPLLNRISRNVQQTLQSQVQKR